VNCVPVTSAGPAAPGLAPGTGLELPETGLDASAGSLLFLAIVCLLVGTTMVLLARERGRTGPAILVSLLVVGTMSALVTIGVQPSAQASTPGCSSASPGSSSPGSTTAGPSSPGTSAPSSPVYVNHLAVSQTSTLEGLAPGVAPIPIAGRLVNEGGDSTWITAVDVEISSITRRSDSTIGSCDASDYLVGDPRMPVEQALGPEGSTRFTGATIGFVNKSSNQDACKGAVIHLRYTANPS